MAVSYTHLGEAIDNEAFNRIENCIDNSVVVKY